MTDILINYLSSTGAFSDEEISFSIQFFKPIHLKKVSFLFMKMNTAIILDLSLVVLSKPTLLTRKEKKI
ncbi:hypothetical protein KUH03_39465 [Sphingobacterium sp. E70]|uniref:hypothetical protein n=1 Tax=Sphingobacterium sp. E70 TaxID=2853439 RepID=UPI00211C6B3E|nr:hypothetical protein [Sphingobacterium sp. E70]ULT24899.1 hypothetical protein KUH03_39465 [Sphingobacterium sp. E70]